MEDDKIKDRFDGRNFSDWKYRMEIFLDDKEVMEHIHQPLSDLLEPYEDSAGDNAGTKKSKKEKREKIQKDDKRCKNLIVQRIESTQLETVKDKRTAYEMWTALEARYEKTSATSRITLTKALQMLVYKPQEETLDEYNSKFDRLIRDLRQAGDQQDDEGVLIQYLLSMPVEYESLVTALRTQAINDLSMDFVRQQVEEYELNKKGKKSKQNHQAPKVAFSGQKREEFKFPCHNCQIVGHKIADCWRPGGGAHRSNQHRGGSGNRGGPGRFHRGNTRGSHRGGRGWQTARRGRGTNHNYNNRTNTQANFTNSDNNAHSDNEENSVERPRYAFCISIDACFVKGDNSKDIPPSDEWTLDSGASDHLARTDSKAQNVRVLQYPVKILVAKTKNFLLAKTIGDFHGIHIANGVEVELSFLNVLLVDNLKCNLLSISQLEDRQCKMSIDNGLFTIFQKNSGNVVGVGKREGSLYKLNYRPIIIEKSIECNFVEKSDLWHERMGHISLDGLKKLKNCADGLENLEVKQDKKCDVCIQGKQTKIPHKQVRDRSSRPLERIHSDVFSVSPTAYNGVKYLVTFIDDFTHFCVSYGLKAKSEVTECVKEFEAMATARFNTKICQFRCDNGREYLNDELENFFREKGIQWELTVPHTPELNGVAERMNRTILDKARCMLLDCSLGKGFWIEAALAAVYLINRSPSRAIEGDRVPSELWYGVRPNLSKIRKFGCVAFVKKSKTEIKSKFDARGKKCIFVGYSANGYRLWSITERKMIHACDVVFDEKRTKFEGESENIWRSSEDKLLSEDEVTDLPDDLPVDEIEISQRECDESSERSGNGDEETNENGNINNEIIRRGSRIRKQPGYWRDYVTNHASVDDFEALLTEESTERTAVVLLTQIFEGKFQARTYYNEDELVMSAVAFCENIPESYDEIENREDKNKWETAIQEELKALELNKTWEVVPLPKGRKPINSKWVFTVKHDSEGDIERYKARVVAKGCSQKEGFDYHETYAPVARLSTLRILLSVCNYLKFYIHQLDVKNAFLNGELKEEIFMIPPKGLKVRNGEVCKLLKTLYGLKQAPMEWNAKFDAFVKGLGFKQCETDKCLYVCISENYMTYLLLYVDDFIIACNDRGALTNLKTILMKEFKMRDLGEINYFLGIKIERRGQDMFLSQSAYIEKLIHKFKMNLCKPKLTPIEVRAFDDVESQVIEGKPYRELIGGLMYACLATRPDISAALNFFSQFQSKPTKALWEGLKRVVKYLQGTKKWGLWYKGIIPIVVVGYADASFANHIDKKSVSGYMFQVFGDLVIWATRKQRTVALSTAEAELVALASAAAELLWLIQMLMEMKINVNKPVTMYEDNQPCIKALVSWNQKRLKHMDIKYNFVKDLVKSNVIAVEHVPSENQTADIFTKGLPYEAFARHRTNLGMCEI